MQDENQYLASPGESNIWAISYSDLLMVVLSFFVLFFSFEDIKKQDQTTGSVAKTESNRQIKALKELIADINIGSIDQTIASLQSSFSNEAQKGAVQQAIQQGFNAKMGNGQSDFVKGPSQSAKDIIFQDRVLYPKGGYIISAEGKQQLALIAELMLEIKNIVSIRIEGHSDSTQPKKVSVFRDNFSLSAMRAGSVARQLIKQGVPKATITVAGFGDLKPRIADKGQPEIASTDPVNRRVSIKITMKQ